MRELTAADDGACRTFNITDQDCLALVVLDDISRMLKSAIDARARMT